MISRNATAQCIKQLMRLNQSRSLNNLTISGPRVALSSQSFNARRLNSTHAASQDDNNSDYISPFKDFFEMIQENKITTGTDANDYSELPLKTLRCGIPETALRFKTVAYGRLALAPYVQPQEHKVTMKVNLEDIPFDNDLEKEIFFQIVGPRFNDSKQELTLTSSQFASRIENKRHAVSMLERIMESSKFLAKDVASSQSQSSS